MGILNRGHGGTAPKGGPAWLAGLRVLDLSRGVAGGFCARLLAELGAAVTRLEPRGPGIAAGPAAEIAAAPPAVRAGLAAWLHAGKAPASADARGIAALDAALRNTDLVVEDWRPAERSALRWTARLDALSAPPLDVSVTDFGLSGPLASLAADELIRQAWSGQMAPGGAGEPPRALPGWNAAQIGGLFAALGALLALRAGAAPDGGRSVAHATVPGLATLHQFALEQAAASPSAGAGAPPGSAGPARGGVLPCADGWVVAAIPEGTPPELLAAVTGDPAFGEDSRLAAAIRGEAPRAPLLSRLGDWLAGQMRDAAVARAQTLQLPFGRVRTLAELRADPQLGGAATWTRRDVPGVGQVRFPSLPFRVTEPPADAPARAAAAPPPAGGLPLAGLRVLELSTAWAGPLVGRWLAEFGAEVVRVEWRPEGPPAPGSAAALRRAAQHRGKAGVALNCAGEPGRDLLRRMAARADVLVENFRPGVLAGWGCGYAELAADNPGLLMLSLSGFGGGDGADEAGWRALGATVEGEAGWAALLGGPSGPPRTLPEPLTDPVAALNGIVALLAALRTRDATGRGTHIALSQRDAALRQVAPLLALPDAPEDGPGLPDAALRGVFRCGGGSDAWLVVSVPDDGAWARLRVLTGWADPAAGVAGELGPATATPRAWAARRDEFERRLGAWCAERTREAALGALGVAGVPAAPVLRPAALLHAPLFPTPDAWLRLDHPEAGSLTHARTPLALAGVAPRHRPAPAYGADTRRVLRDWAGLADNEIDALVREGTVVAGEE